MNRKKLNIKENLEAPNKLDLKNPREEKDLFYSENLYDLIRYKYIKLFYFIYMFSNIGNFVLKFANKVKNTKIHVF